MNSYLQNLFSRYRNKGILIDTNILLLLFVGSVDRRRIPLSSRTANFTPEDYDHFSGIFMGFEKRITTPSILTEVSNLLPTPSDNLRESFFKGFATTLLKLLEERYTRSDELVKTAPFLRLGLTDTGIIHLAQEKYLVFTDDGPLAGYLSNQGIDVLNANRLRIL